MKLLVLLFISFIVGQECRELEDKLMVKEIELDYMVKHFNEWKSIILYIVQGLGSLITVLLPVYITIKFRKGKK